MKTAANPEIEEIRVRFFQAIEILEQAKGFTAYKFAQLYDLDRSNFMKLRKPGAGQIPAWFLTKLVSDHGISANWLLTGKGKPN